MKRSATKKVYIGSDHAGFFLKQDLKRYLERLGILYEDVGSMRYEPKDDYPDIALAVARKVVKEGARGILICDSGVGVCIVANKVKGVRAANVFTVGMARHTREDNDSNVLCLGQEYIKKALARRIVKAWLAAPFSRKKRHVRRVGKIKKIEKGAL